MSTRCDFFFLLTNKETLMNVRVKMELIKPKQNGHCLQAGATVHVGIKKNTHQINSHTQYNSLCSPTIRRLNIEPVSLHDIIASFLSFRFCFVTCNEGGNGVNSKELKALAVSRYS